MPRGAPSGLGGEPVSVAQVPPHRPPLGEPLSRAASFLPLVSGLTPWAGLPQWVLSQDAWLGPGLALCWERLSRASLRSGLIWSPSPWDPSDRPLIAREIQVFERCLLSVFPQSLAECAARGKGSVDGGCRHRSRVLPSSPQLQKRGAAVPTLQVENPAWRRGLSGPTLSGSQQWDLNPGLFTSAVGFFFFFLPFYPTSLLCCSPQTKPISGIPHFKGIWNVTWGLSGYRIAFSPNPAEGDLARTRKVAGTRGRD